MKKHAIRVLTVLLTGVLLISGGYIAYKLLDYHRGAQSYAAATQAAGLPKRLETPQTNLELPDAPPELSCEEQLAALDLSALQAVNPDVLGWIAIPDTDLSYPLLQTYNNTYYLNRLWDKTRNSSGSIYLEQTSSPDFSDFNTIVYGHRMRDTSMFGTLPLYRDQDFFLQHPTVYLADANGVHQYAIFAAYEVGVREIVYRLDIEENGWQQKFIDFGLEHSVIQTDVVPTVEDHILTLSTCTERGHANRWVVQAVLQDTSEEPAA